MAFLGIRMSQRAALDDQYLRCQLALAKVLLLAAVVQERLIAVLCGVATKPQLASLKRERPLPRLKNGGRPFEFRIDLPGQPMGEVATCRRISSNILMIIGMGRYYHMTNRVGRSKLSIPHSTNKH